MMWGFFLIQCDKSQYYKSRETVILLSDNDRTTHWSRIKLLTVYTCKDTVVFTVAKVSVHRSPVKHIYAVQVQCQYHGSPFICYDRNTFKISPH